MQSRSMLTNEKYNILENYMNYAPCGNFAELGVYKGGVAHLMATACKKDVYLFDTFTGIPNADRELDRHHNGDFNDTSIEEVKELLKEFNNVVYCEGLFPETTKLVSDDAKFTFVHLDGDTYRSTIDGLNYFFPRLISGGFIVLDDYDWEPCPGVNTAINEFNAKNKFSGYTAITFKNQYVIGKK